MTEDEELAKIRQRKMQELIRRSQQSEVREPLAKGTVEHLTEQNFWSTLKKTNIALVDFFAEWCGPCKALTPIFQRLAQDYEGEAFIGKIDIDRNQRAAQQFGVQSVPMVVVFKNGEPVGRLPGLRTYNDYSSIIERFLKETSSE
ncbi:MAG: thioredoxin [Candidatus Lokiarchaeota archaeon]|nr:thioredoxin [Candidatus Lokiarchaeota archaeon]